MYLKVTIVYSQHIAYYIMTFFVYVKETAMFLLKSTQM